MALLHQRKSNHAWTDQETPKNVESSGLLGKTTAKIGFAFAYALSSIIIMSVTKITLTTYKFPSPTVILVGQIVTTIVILSAAKRLKWINYPDFSTDLFSKLHPLPILYLANATTGLGGTKALSLPMFTAFRRFSILMTMILEYYVLGVKTSSGIQISVYVMIVGAFIAALNDFTVSFYGCRLVMLNNLLTAVKGVIIKKKLNTTECGPYGILYYNAIFSFVPAIVVSYVLGDIDKAIDFPNYGEFYFWISLFLSCTMGFVLVWTMVECTHYNSPLTTSIAGAVKNIFVSYAGMFIGGDYIFGLYNFIGINISVIGSVIYTLVTIS